MPGAPVGEPVGEAVGEPVGALAGESAEPAAGLTGVSGVGISKICPVPSGVGRG